MFNRPRPAHGAATAAFDEVLTELEGAAAGQPDAVATPAGAAAVDEHADTLRATRDAQQQAQAMLVMAAQARSSATEQAEQILLEARTAADRMREEAGRDAERLRAETADWVSSRRARVEEAVAEVTGSATRDAEAIRADAMRTAMVEAEETARRYVGEAVARGARDAEELRAQAREVLVGATELAHGVRTTVGAMTGQLEDYVAELHSKLRAIDETLTQTPARERAAGSVPPPPAPAQDVTGDDAVDPYANDPLGQGPLGIDPLGADPLGDEPERRQLGALFRDTVPGRE